MKEIVNQQLLSISSCVRAVGITLLALSLVQAAHPESSTLSPDPSATSSGQIVDNTPRARSVWAPIYKPPYPNAPNVRVQGITRGSDDAALALTVLAPEHVGLTIKDQPSLFWFQSRTANARFELTIAADKEATPVLEAKLNAATTDGIQRFRLSNTSVKLKKDVEYRWSVAMVLDPENRSRDVVASGVIKRITPSPELISRLAKSPSDAAAIYADEGVWYDSLEALSDLIEQKPADMALHEERAMFFMQVGLKDAAVYDAKTASAK